jgi:gas vesicle protein
MKDTTNRSGMYYEKNSRAFNFVLGLTLGTAVGAGLALLTAPRSGRRTRRRLGKVVSEATDTAGERWGELSDDLRSAVGPGWRRFRP